jgi:bifunctional DNA-binding transcriptional regulator/antitoxin component of YhaV-PrlF toxin-antitoxin module
MTVIVKNREKLVVPQSVRRQAGIRPGDRLVFKVSGRVISIVPELPSADDEYTPDQRSAIDARLAHARRGPYHGPFDTADEAVTFLKKEVRSRKAKQKTPQA